MNYVAIDIETTGPDPTTCEIVEIGATKFDDFGTPGSTKEWPCIFDPTNLTAEAHNLHGIGEPLPKAHRPDRACELLLNWVASDLPAGEKATIIGHNFAQYDLIAFMRYVMKAHWDSIFTYRLCDTSVLGTALVTAGILDKQRGLKGYLEHFDLDTTGLHHARKDSGMEGQLWFAMTDMIRGLNILERPAHSHDEKLPAGFACLRGVLDEAFQQAFEGKGQERHARGQDFHQQQWAQQRKLWGDGGCFFQMAKKAHESLAFDDWDRKDREVLGSIIYAAMSIVGRRMGV